MWLQKNLQTQTATERGQMLSDRRRKEVNNSEGKKTRREEVRRKGFRRANLKLFILQ
jgi:hypothetical protein